MINPLCNNGFFPLVCYNTFRMVHCIYQATGYNFQIELYFSKNIFVLADSVDPDEMSHDATFHMGLHSIPKHAFRVQYYTKG